MDSISTEHKVCGINQSKAENLILDIYDLAEKITASFNKCDKIIEPLSLSNDTPAIKAIVKQYGKIRDNFSIVNANLLSYASDITSAKNNYASFISDISFYRKEEEK